MKLETMEKEAFAGDYESVVLEQWKTCIAEANGISEKRNNANNIFITLNTALFIVLMSEATKYSWWVPFEIGMSAQIDMPTATYLKDNVVLPSYLSYWPRLKTIKDVSTYVSVRKKTKRALNEQYSNFELSSVSNRRKIETPIFYENLKRELR